MNAKVWAVVPAAGAGQRMQATKPKQYLNLLGQPVLQRTLTVLCNTPAVSGVQVGLSADDGYWSDMAFTHEKLFAPCTGGTERVHTVLACCLQLQLLEQAQPTDWVLVHDAARPCLTQREIHDLIAAVEQHNACGGLLALPVVDTVKRSNAEGESIETIDRSQLWRAQTPQLFRLQPLCDALQAALAQDKTITDEASAMEFAGFKPLLVEGLPTNIKITLPSDLDLAAKLLEEAL